MVCQDIYRNYYQYVHEFLELNLFFSVLSTSLLTCTLCHNYSERSLNAEWQCYCTLGLSTWVFSYTTIIFLVV